MCYPVADLGGRARALGTGLPWAWDGSDLVHFPHLCAVWGKGKGVVSTRSSTMEKDGAGRQVWGANSASNLPSKYE